MVDAGFRDFADRWNPIMTSSMRSACASRWRFIRARSPTTTGPPSGTLQAIGERPAFGINLDPSHLVWQLVDPVRFALRFGERIYNVHVKGRRARP